MSKKNAPTAAPDKKKLKQFKELLERAINEVTADIGP